MNHFVYKGRSLFSQDLRKRRNQGYLEQLAYLNAMWEQEAGDRRSMNVLYPMWIREHNAVLSNRRKELYVQFVEHKPSNTTVAYGIALSSYTDPGTLFYSSAYVHPDYREKGIFTYITDQYIKYAAKNNFEKIVATPNELSRSLLLKKGFIEISSQDGSPEFVKYLHPYHEGNREMRGFRK